MSDKGQNHRDRTITRFIHRLFLKAITRSKGWFTLSLLLNAPGFFIFHVLIPLQIAYGIQSIITRNFHEIRGHIIVLLVLAVVHTIVFSAGNLSINRCGAIACGYVQRRVFANFLEKDYDFYSDSYAGALGAQAARLRDAAFEYHHLLFFEVPKQLAIVVAGIVIIGLQSLQLALLTFGCMLVVLSVTIITSAWRLKYRRLLGQASNDLVGVMGDALSHAPVVKSFSAENYEKQRLEKSLTRWQKIQLKTWDTAIPSHTPRNVLNIIIICVLLALTANLYKNNSITIATVALIQLYVIKLVAATLDIAEIVKAYEAAMGAAYSPAQTMLVAAAVKDPINPKTLPPDYTQTIICNKVSYRYADSSENKLAIRDFSLQINPGEKIGIVGPSGSGKTTLSKLLLRFMDTTAGSISLGGIDIRDITQHDLRTSIAYVPQEPLLFHRSIAENILYGRPDASKEQLQQAIRTAHVDEFVGGLPDGIGTLVGERGIKLSGGQRQRVAIARALLKAAPILLLDEATSALDSKSERYIQTALAKLMENRTAIVIAHRLSTIQRLDRIVVINKGKITQIGTHKELLRDKKGIYYDLWQHQVGGYIATK